MDLVRLFEYLGLGGFILWSLMERGFSLFKQRQEKGRKQSQISFWLINIFWYGAMFFAILDVWTLNWTTFNQNQWLLRIIGLILIIVGLALRFIARRDLGKQYSVHVETSEKHQLITEGIYQKIRHPAYLGLLCLFLGIPLCIGSWGGLIIAVVGGIPAVMYRITVEETSLHNWFGEQFDEYAQDSWRLLPHVW